jgi:hypothetical protein
MEQIVISTARLCWWTARFTLFLMVSFIFLLDAHSFGRKIRDPLPVMFGGCHSLRESTGRHTMLSCLRSENPRGRVCAGRRRLQTVAPAAILELSPVLAVGVARNGMRVAHVALVRFVGTAHVPAFSVYVCPDRDRVGRLELAAHKRSSLHAAMPCFHGAAHHRRIRILGSVLTPALPLRISSTRSAAAALSTG